MTDNDKSISRRKFLQFLGAIGGTALVAPAFVGPIKQVFNGVWWDEPHGVGTSYQDYTAENVIFTSCAQCNTFCTIKVYMTSGAANGPYSSIVRKIAGNQYSPMNMVPFGQIAYNTPVAQAVKGTGNVARDGRGFRGGRTCLKGQAGIQTAYDAYRLRQPIKRVGPRGSGKWQTIPWEEAYDLILNGSAELQTPGLKQIYAYVPEKPVMEDWEKVKNKQMGQADFDANYKDVLIDTRHPDFGPKSNQIVFMAGNRRSLITRLTSQSFGTVNMYDHGGVCGVSSTVGNVRSYDGPKPKKRMIPDFENAEFVIAWGTNPLVSNKGPTTLAPQLTNALMRGMKLAVIDARFSKTAEKADMWIPVKPGTDAALALAMGRWIIENTRFDQVYLTNPNKKAAGLDGEPTWSDATYLVNLSDKQRPYLRASDLGIGSKDQFVVLQGGKPVPHDQATEGTLEVSTTIGDFKVKTAFTLYKERVMEKTLNQYADICKIPEENIIALAREFTSHEKKVGIIAYRGPAKHGNGYYNTRAINMLHHLIGNHDWKGGNTTTGAKFQEWEGRYDLTTVKNANTAWGLPIGRDKSVYEKSTLFARDGYPAKRPWFPFAGNMVHEILPSAAEGYPYPIKALFINRFSPVMSNPRSDLQMKILQDQKVIPLVVASDITIGESSRYADLILPDLSYLESWNNEDIFPILKTKFSSVYQPVTRVIPDAREADQVYLDLAKRIGLPGVGKSAFPDGGDFEVVEDYYLKRVANIAFDGKNPVLNANADELKIFESARQKSLGKYADISRWKQSVKPEEWPKVVYVLNRGGRFEAAGEEYIGNHLKYQFGNQANFYDEKVAGKKHSYSGKFFDGIPMYQEIMTYNGKLLENNLPYQFINWKSRNMGTHRTTGDAWLREIRPENYVWINSQDASKEGLKTGDTVIISTGQTEAKGTVLVTEGIKPGVIGSNYNFGSFAFGMSGETIDGVTQQKPKKYNHTPFHFNTPGHEESGYAGSRNGGFSVNRLLYPDDSYFGGTVIDLIGGSPGQMDLRVMIQKA